MNAAIGIPITTNAAEPASTVCLIALLILVFGFWFRGFLIVRPILRARLGQGNEKVPSSRLSRTKYYLFLN